MEKILSREEISSRIDPEKVKQNCISFEECMAQEMKDPAFRKAYEAECLRYEIAAKIRETRKNMHLTQLQLAKEASTTQKVISKIENGEVAIGVDLLQKVTQALGLRIMIA